MSKNPHRPPGSGRHRGTSGYEPTEVAQAQDDLEGFVSGEYSDIATRVSGKQKGAALPTNRDVTMPSAKPTERKSGRRSAVPSLATADARSRTMAREEILDGRYRVVDLIARGSMSRVYLAEHISIGRPVALKIINRDLVGESDSVQRFQQEARVLARVGHPNIVTLYDIGETATGDPYIVMEYIRGASLAAIIKAKRRLDPTRTIGLLLQIARGLATVHEAGVVHRDLKPSNILVVRSDQGAIRAKIADFGLAKVLQERGGGEFLTRAGAILGTPEYMAPEQVKGGAVDRRADLYSLGCMAYEMLTGSPPFVGQEMATLYKQLHEVPKPLREAAPDAAIPESLEPVIRKALQKDPEERYSTAEQLYRDLQRAADKAGIDRKDIALVESFADDSFDDETKDGLAPVIATPPVRDRPRGLRGPVLGLLVATVAVIALVVGVAVGKFAVGADDRAPVFAPPVAEATGLVVTTQPDKAMVSLDGGEPQRAPATFSGIEPGEHTLEVERPGFVTKTTTVEADLGLTSVVSVPLERPTYHTKIRSTPEGASVEIDGEEVGETPVTAELTEGEFHEIAISRAGFQSTTRFVGAGERVDELAIALRPALLEYATLFVDSDSPARVLIDGVDTGEWTPTGEIQITPGRHEVTVVDRVGVERRRRIRMGANDVERLQF